MRQRFEVEFNKRLYNKAVFDTLRPNSGGRYSVDTSVVLKGIGLPDENHDSSKAEYTKARKEYLTKFCHDAEIWFSSMPVTIPLPILMELANKKKSLDHTEKMRKLLNRSNVRFLVDNELLPHNWQKTLPKYVPVVVRNLNDFIRRETVEEYVPAITIYDAHFIAIAACENQPIVSLDNPIMEASFRLNILYHDFVKDPKLPRKIPT